MSPAKTTKAAAKKAPAAKKPAGARQAQNAPRGGGAPKGADIARTVGRAAGSAGATMPRLRARYRDEVQPRLEEELGLANVMQVPRLEKIVVNMGVGRATQQPSLI